MSKKFYTNVALIGNNILVKGVHDGHPFREKVKFKPYHFVPSKEPTEYTSTTGMNVSKVMFDNIYEAKDFIAKYDGVENFDIFGSRRYAYTYIRDNFQDMEFDYDRISVVYFDIETMSDSGFPDVALADKEVIAVSFRKGDERIVISTADYTPPEGATYHKVRDEDHLLRKFIEVWTFLDPDIVSGWNVEFFDVPYIINRITRVLGEDESRKLSPWLKVFEYTTKAKWGSEQSSYRILGVTVVDLMAAYMKFTFKNQESFKLDYIAFVELGEKKLDYSEYGSLHQLWVQNPQKFIDYNLHDSDLVFRINQKTGLINQIITLAYDARVNYADAFTSVLLWEVIIDNHLFSQGRVTPTFTKKNRKMEPIMGAFVKDPIIGKHEWTAGLDLDSLYPHIMMQYNISPETFVKCYKTLRHEVTVEDIIDGKLMDNSTIKEMVEDKGFGYTPNGAFFRNEKRGFLAELMDIMYMDRKRYKKLMLEAKGRLEHEKDPAKRFEIESEVTRYHNMQMAKKICLNSAYGALSNEYFAFYDIDLAEAITYAGQLAIKWISYDLNKFLNDIMNRDTFKDYVIANDTDSCYLDLTDLVDMFFDKGTEKDRIVTFIDKVCSDRINPFINKSYDRMAKYTNAFENKMSMKVESISDAAIWKAKKMYAMNVHWKEGVKYEKPKVEIKGLSAVRSSTPMMCREKIKDALRIILVGKKEELYSLVDSFEKEFRNASFEEISRTASITDIEKYEVSGPEMYAKATPIHAKGAIVYNRLLKEKGLQDKYQKIRSMDKVKYCILKVPNPIREKAISCPDILPKEFGLDEFLDYYEEFDKVFVTPVNDLARLVGWDINSRSSLEALFGE